MIHAHRISFSDGVELEVCLISPRTERTLGPSFGEEQTVGTFTYLPGGMVLSLLQAELAFQEGKPSIVGLEGKLHRNAVSLFCLTGSLETGDI